MAKSGVPLKCKMVSTSKYRGTTQYLCQTFEVSKVSNDDWKVRLTLLPDTSANSSIDFEYRVSSSILVS